MDTHPTVHGCKIVNHHHSSGSTKQPTIIPIRAHPHHISQLIATDCADSLTTQIHHRSTKMAGNQIYTQPNQSRARNPPTELSFSSYTDQQREIDPWSPDKQTTRRSWTTTKKHPARTVRSKKNKNKRFPSPRDTAREGEEREAETGRADQIATASIADRLARIRRRRRRRGRSRGGEEEKGQLPVRCGWGRGERWGKGIFPVGGICSRRLGGRCDPGRPIGAARARVCLCDVPTNAAGGGGGDGESSFARHRPAVRFTGLGWFGLRPRLLIYVYIYKSKL
jgi:hypothetical protein